MLREGQQKELSSSIAKQFLNRPTLGLRIHTTTAVLTVVAYVPSQQLEGNLHAPRIQDRALHVHPIVVLLAVIGGGQIGGLAGVIFAVPTLAVLRVLFDFFSTRIRTKRDPDAGHGT